jgi:hypothetical protein
MLKQLSLEAPTSRILYFSASHPLFTSLRRAYMAQLPASVPAPKQKGFHGVKLGTLPGEFEAVLPLSTIAHRHIEPAIRVRTCLKFNSTQ